MCSTVLLVKRGILPSSWSFLWYTIPLPSLKRTLAPENGSFWGKMPIFWGELFVWGSVYFGCRALSSLPITVAFFVRDWWKRDVFPSSKWPQNPPGKNDINICHFGQGGKMISFFPWVGYVIVQRRVYVNLVWNFKYLFYPVVWWWNHLRINH